MEQFGAAGEWLAGRGCRKLDDLGFKWSLFAEIETGDDLAGWKLCTYNRHCIIFRDAWTLAGSYFVNAISAVRPFLRGALILRLRFLRA
jgi:hypothetical protein